MEFIDNHPVVEHQVRFRLRATVDEHEAELVRDGDVVLWLVKTRCLPPQYFPVAKDSDERYKLAIQDVEDAAPLPGALRESAIVYLDHGQDQGYIALEQSTLPLDLAFEAPRHTADGLQDPALEAEVRELREMLVGVGGQRPGERLAETVRRLLFDEVQRVLVGQIPEPPAEDRPLTGAERYLDDQLQDPQYVAAYERATAALHDEEPEPVPVPDRRPHIPLLGEGDVEVVGSIYRGGRSKLRDFLDTEFGERP